MGQEKSNLKERKGGHEGRKKKNGGAGEKQFKREKRGSRRKKKMVGQEKSNLKERKGEHWGRGRVDRKENKSNGKERTQREYEDNALEERREGMNMNFALEPLLWFVKMSPAVPLLAFEI